MANTNMSSIKKIVAKLGLQCQLIPSDTNPLNCKWIMIQGKQLKSSQWNKTDAENILSQYADNPCKAELEALDDIFKNAKEDNLKELINFKGQSLTSCFEEFRLMLQNDSIYSVDSWIKTMTDFFTSEITNKANIDACANKIKSMIDNKEVYILNGFVYSNYELSRIIQIWKEENNIKANINKDIVISKYINAVRSL